MPSSTRRNKDKRLLFSEDPAHLERTICNDQRFTLIDAIAFTSTDSCTQPSTDTRPSSPIDLHRSTSIDTTSRTSIDHQSRNMVAIVILRHDENGDMYDQDGHLHADFWQVVKHEKLREGDFEVESSMSFGGSHWFRPMLMDTHRSTDHDEDRSKSSAKSFAECSAVQIMTHEEFAEKHPHPPSPFYVKIIRPHESAVDRQPPPKPIANQPEPTTNPSDTTPEPMQVDEVTEGRRLRKRKEKIPKNLKRDANEKEMNGFTKRVLRIPVEKSFDEFYFAHRLWMFFRETKETEEDIRKMYHHIRERMKLRITLKKKSDPGKFAIPCVVKGIEFPHALCDTGASVHAQQYQKQQGQTPVILRRSCSLGMNDPQRPTFHIARRNSFHVDRFSHPTVDRHPTFTVDRSTSFDIDRYYTVYINQSSVAKHGCDCYSQTRREWKPL
ncbi:hypothetical protein DY000_02030859 [Brassica cretica]|uniref:Uncharacterized protein n=1 Tax=Brassica cretica TaxID=69181 RepID=A0ABQ7DIL6_BRACR|nr:hypothetical protein DY000_02030859 [Brassica cretica]